jgi:hypothetical protein
MASLSDIIHNMLCNRPTKVAGKGSKEMEKNTLI